MAMYVRARDRGIWICPNATLPMPALETLTNLSRQCPEAHSHAQGLETPEIWGLFSDGGRRIKLVV